MLDQCFEIANLLLPGGALCALSTQDVGEDLPQLSKTRTRILKAETL